MNLSKILFSWTSGWLFLPAYAHADCHWPKDVAYLEAQLSTLTPNPSADQVTADKEDKLFNCGADVISQKIHATKTWTSDDLYQVVYWMAKTIPFGNPIEQEHVSHQWNEDLVRNKRKTVIGIANSQLRQSRITKDDYDIFIEMFSK